MDAIDTLALFTRHYQEPQDPGEVDSNEGGEEVKRGGEQGEDNDMDDDYEDES